MTTTLRVGRPQDLIALTGYQLGFVPTESLVLVSVRGPVPSASRGHQVGLVLRVDLPRGAAGDLVSSLAGHLRRDGAVAAYALVYTGQAWTDLQRPPRGGLVREVTHGLARAGVPVQQIVHVTASTFRPYECTDLGCCPMPGHPLVLAESSPIASEMVLRGRVVAADRAEMVSAALPPLGPGEPAVTAHAARWDAVRASHPGPDGHQQSAASQRWRARTFRVWRSCLRAGVDPVAVATQPPVAGRLLSGLADVEVRDAALLSLVPACGGVPEEVLAGRAPDGIGALLDQAPDPDVMARGRDVVTALLRVAPAERTAPALAMLAWMAWSCGEGALAREAVDRALLVDPQHRLAGLLDQVLAAGVPPAWAGHDISASGTASGRPGSLVYRLPRS